MLGRLSSVGAETCRARELFVSGHVAEVMTQALGSTHDGGLEKGDRLSPRLDRASAGRKQYANRFPLTPPARLGQMLS